MNLGSDCYIFGPTPSSEGGGGGTENPPSSNSCNLSCSEAVNASSAFIGIEIPEDIAYEAGTTTLTPTGKIRKPLNPRQGLVTLKVFPGFEPGYSAFFKGIVYKKGPNDADWKWESCAYNYSGLSGGTEAPCIEITKNVNVSDCVISDDKIDVTTEISFQFKVAYVCPITIHYASYSGGGGRPYHFSSNGAW